MCKCVLRVRPVAGRLCLRIDGRCAQQRRFLRLRRGRSKGDRVENLKLIADGLKSSLALVDVFVASCRSHPFRVLQPFRIFVSDVVEVAAVGAFSSRL